MIDLTGPRQRQALFFAKKMRGFSRFAVGRNAGFFRKRIYDRIFDEKAKQDTIPTELLERERTIQREVLALAGVAFVPMGDLPPDRGKITPLDARDQIAAHISGLTTHDNMDKILSRSTFKRSRKRALRYKFGKH